jgi:putative addiction module killer protein
VADIRRTEPYIKWFRKLGDTRAKAKIYARIERLSEGNAGDHRFSGEIHEMRMDYGPGYRVYYKTSIGCQDSGRETIILLCGGDKTTQQADIGHAREIAQNYVLEEDECHGKDKNKQI